jgi:hypothetical protein
MTYQKLLTLARQEELDEDNKNYHIASIELQFKC